MWHGAGLCCQAGYFFVECSLVSAVCMHTSILRLVAPLTNTPHVHGWLFQPLLWRAACSADLCLWASPAPCVCLSDSCSFCALYYMPLFTLLRHSIVKHVGAEICKAWKDTLFWKSRDKTFSLCLCIQHEHAVDHETTWHESGTNDDEAP
jgi:hypothetical protein